MKDISKTKLVIIAIVTILSVWLTAPTALYYAHLRGEVTPVGGLPPQPNGKEPAVTDVESHTRWEQDNPQLIAWRKQNGPYLAWEAKSEALLKNAIPLGLDLLGGVDITLALDREKSIANMMQTQRDALQKRFEQDKIGAQLQTSDNDQALTVKLMDKKDAQSAANLIAQYKGTFNEAPAAEQLAAGPVKLTLNAEDLNRNVQGDIEGARKGITDRIDALGVTQPRVSLQGQDRIRVQVPGEKDPQKLIANVIKPAQLEFRLVHPDSNSLIDPQTGKLKPGATLPLGTEYVPGKIANYNKTTKQIEEHDAGYVLYKKAEITGADLNNASVTINTAALDPNEQVQVALDFNKEGTRKFSDLTTQNANQNRQMAILLDKVVHSAPRINDPITEGRASIYGHFTQEEATELSQILKAGSLKAPLKIESSRTVGATLGNQSIRSGVEALVGGGVIIAIFMVCYYGTSGFIAVITLILNILMVLAIMALSRATLTLSGIGGLLLTIGMAVDGNVLIYERIREELRNGRPLRQAINLGYHRAFGVIFDSHITSLMSALVLLQFTEGSVFGFALTMTFGLLANLYTSLTVTHTFCSLWHSWRGDLSMGKLSFFTNPKIRFVELRNFSFSLSGAITVIALIVVIARGGLQYGVDFAGGCREEVQFKENVSEAQIRDALKAGFAEPFIQSVPEHPNYYIIDVPLAKLKDIPQAERGSHSELSFTQDKLEKTLQQSFADKYDIKLRTGFGSQSGQEFAKLAIIVVVLASLAIVIYLWFRFELVFGVAAVVALLHDLLVVVLLGTLWHVQINLDVVAALMVLMGFSVNDTIVIFDRIRENAHLEGRKSFAEICDDAMNMSLSRTLITSGTVFFAVAALYALGGEGLRPFAKIYLLGTITGTYSSDFIAAPLVFLWNKWHKNSVLNQLQSKRGKIEAAKPIGRPGAAASAR